MIDENSIKDAFAKAKSDIFSLGNEIYSLRNEILELKTSINALNESVDNIKIEFLDSKSSSKTSNLPTDTPTDNPNFPTVSVIPSDNPTVPMEVRGLKYPNLDSSTRNRGVPTDRQTNQQTDNLPLKNSIQEAEDLLNSLDTLKKEIRIKFKQMTHQEMLVFSTIYQLEEHFPEGLEYRQIAAKLQLSESSIRDYTQKLITKGIPIDKIKLNNKKILLKISSKLRNIAPLETIMKLREL